MELWVRSQDRTDLVKANALWVMDNQIWMEVPFYENHKKIGLTITGYNHKLAEYKTKERALEVLDEIQNILMPRITYTPIVEEDIKPQYTYRHFISEKGETNILELSTYVYDMPQE